MKFYLKAACASNIGQYRGNNEDNIFFDGVVLPADSQGTNEPLYQESNLRDPEDFGVFDGMGGHADGQIASYIAARVFKAGHDEDPDDSKEFFEQVMFEMSDAVWKRAEEDASNTGTTASVLRIDEDTYYLANVGDSPVFLLRDGELQQISVNHTDEIYFKNIRGNTKRKPALTQYIGIDPETLVISPYLEEGDIYDGDRFLLCSDGLTDMVPKEELKEILSQQKDIRDIVLDLIDDANAHGGRDNITVILLDISEGRKGIGKHRNSSGNISSENISSEKKQTFEKKQTSEKKQTTDAFDKKKKGRTIILSVILALSLVTAAICSFELIRENKDAITSSIESISNRKTATDSTDAELMEIAPDDLDPVTE